MKAQDGALTRRQQASALEAGIAQIPIPEARPVSVLPGLEARLGAGAAAMGFQPIPTVADRLRASQGLPELLCPPAVLLDGAVGGIALRLVLRPEGSVRILTHLCDLRVPLTEPVEEDQRRLASWRHGCRHRVWPDRSRRLRRCEYLLGLGERGRRTGTLAGRRPHGQLPRPGVPLGFGHELVSFLLSTTCIGLSLLQHRIRRDLCLGRVVVGVRTHHLSILLAG